MWPASAAGWSVVGSRSPDARLPADGESQHGVQAQHFVPGLGRCAFRSSLLRLVRLNCPVQVAALLLSSARYALPSLISAASWRKICGNNGSFSSDLGASHWLSLAMALRLGRFTALFRNHRAFLAAGEPLLSFVVLYGTLWVVGYRPSPFGSGVLHLWCATLAHPDFADHIAPAPSGIFRLSLAAVEAGPLVVFHVGGQRVDGLAAEGSVGPAASFFDVE